MDVILTDRGRELLSKNQLNFVYYAFSDALINYSGSLSSSLALSGSTLDSYVYDIFTYEADGKFHSPKPWPGTPIYQTSDNQIKTLDSFLYTTNQSSLTLPELKISAAEDVTLEKRYKISNVKKIIENFTTELKNASTVVVNAEISNVSREQSYITEQQQRAVLDLIGGTQAQKDIEDGKIALKK